MSKLSDQITAGKAKITQMKSRVIADAVREIARRTALHGNDKHRLTLKDARTLATAHASADWIAKRYSGTSWKPLTAYINGLTDAGRESLDKAIQRAYADQRKRDNAHEDVTQSA